MPGIRLDRLTVAYALPNRPASIGLFILMAVLLVHISSNISRNVPLEIALLKPLISLDVNNMNYIFTTLLLFVCVSQSWAQVVLQGKVTDITNSGLPLGGATVLALPGSQGSVTDSSGHFLLRSNQPIASIQISHIGYKTQTVAVKAGDTMLTIALASAESQTLEEVRVTSKYYKQYTISTVSSALRLQTPLINLSQNIQAISSELIYDQASFNMTESVSRNVSGVIRQEVSNNLGPYLFMRGGQIAALRNGIDLTPIYRGPSPDDAAIIDRVEFIKGPSLFMNNIGDPAGSFNVVTKQPTGTRRTTLNAMFGSWNLYRLAADFDGMLDQKGKLQYRLNVMGLTTNSFVKFDFNQRFLVAPVLKYVLNKRTYISAEYMFQRFRYGMHSPIVMTPNGFANLPIDFTITEKSLNPYHVSDQTGFLTFSHQLSDQWKLTARGAFMRNDNEGAYMWVTGVNTAAPNMLLRNPKYDLNRTLVFSQQAFVNGQIRTGSINHQILTGVDVNQKKFLANSYVEYDNYKATDGTMKLTYYPLDVSNPVYGVEIPDYTTPGGLANRNTTQTIHYYSIYVLDELGMFANKLRLTIGGRYTALRTHNEVSGVTTSSSDGILTPRLGISYSLLPSLSIYGLYDRTFLPQVGLISSGKAVSPLRGENREIGIKKNWLGGRWNTTLSVYRINRANIIATDPNNSLYRIQIGETSSQGIEMDIMGQVVNGLNVVINYAYNDAKVDNDVNKALIGARTPMYVKHIQNTWLNYALPTRILPGFTLSLGYQYQGGRGERFATATPHTTPDYFRLDGGIGWQRDRFKLNVLVNNVLNKHLIATPWFRNGLYYWVPQAPINGRLTASYSF